MDNCFFVAVVVIIFVFFSVVCFIWNGMLTNMSCYST